MSTKTCVTGNNLILHKALFDNPKEPCNTRCLRMDTWPSLGCGEKYVTTVAPPGEGVEHISVDPDASGYRWGGECVHGNHPHQLKLLSRGRGFGNHLNA